MVIDKGTAKIKNLSLGGARLIEVKLDRDSIPIEPFNLLIHPKNGTYKGAALRSQIVRLTMNGRVELGVRFQNVDAQVAKSLRKLMGL